ncbi:hypothetical protein Ddye_020304, partial [Dipteronia dyeriana]
HYVIQGKEYNMSYYLANGIYPKWFTLVQTIHDPHDRKIKLFAMKLERRRTCIWSSPITICNCDRTSIEDRMEAPTPEVKMVLDENTRFQEYQARHREIMDKEAHIAL